MLQTLPPNRVVRLSNITCPYCGVAFSESIRPDREHVIGRRFVPKGVLANEWNLIVNSCHPCNHEKSQLEDDIAVITLMSGRSREDVATSELVASEVARRAEKSGSRATGRSVASSHVEVGLALSPAGGGEVNLKFNGPPQISDARVFRLAEFHYLALFYFVSYRESEKTGGYPGTIRPVGRFMYSDWGNPAARWFMELQKEWGDLFCGNMADGFFKASIKESPTSRVWALAVEWNQSVRVLALAGDVAALDEICSTLPEKNGFLTRNADGNIVRVAKHVPMPESEDLMFQCESSDIAL